MKIAFFNTKSYDRVHFERFAKKSGHEISFFEDYLSPHTASLCMDHQAVCVFVNDKVTAEVIGKLHEYGVGIISLRCAGFNNVDLEAANEKNIKVVRVPAYSPEAVAEHAVALLLTLNRKTHKAFNRVRDSNFSIEGLTGFNLHGKTVGVIGTGAIGKAFCRIMLGFGCRVIGMDPYPSKEVEAMGVEYVTKEQLAKESDIISLHCPLTPDTHHIVNERTIADFKKEIVLINTSRGGLIDTRAAIKALKTKKISALAIDVYEQEENVFFKDLSDEVVQDDVLMRLMTFPNVLITSHQAFLTEEALEQIAGTTIGNLDAYAAGDHLANLVK
jgi:D-lactate dehydrogenase